MWKKVALAVAMTTASSCGGRPEDRQEVIASLRTFGVSAQPLVASPAGSTLVTLHAAIPLGATATLAPFVDTGSGGGAVPLPSAAIEIQAGSDKYEEFNKFRLYTAVAKLSIPPEEAFRGRPFKGGQIRYGLTVSTPTEHENVIANLDVFPAGAPETAWQNPTIDITEPAAGATVSTSSDIGVTANPFNANDERLTIGWFTSDGQIANRRATETRWILTNAGPQTLTVVVHGGKSRGFAIKTINVTGQ